MMDEPFYFMHGININKGNFINVDLLKAVCNDENIALMIYLIENWKKYKLRKD